jgi:hypothetical protein
MNVYQRVVGNHKEIEKTRNPESLLTFICHTTKPSRFKSVGMLLNCSYQQQNCNDDVFRRGRRREACFGDFKKKKNKVC